MIVLDTAQMLLLLSGATGVAGMENGAEQAARELLAPLGTLETTPLGALVCRVKNPPSAKRHLLLTAHLDEIGLVVTRVDEKGFLRVANCGGVDRATLPAAQVLVHGQDGALPGVVCTIPPHLSDGEDQYLKPDEMVIDIGFPADQAKMRVAPGDRITLDVPAAMLQNGRIRCKAADDRAGCAAVILAAQKLAGAPLDCALSVLLTSMEEVGGQGAKTGAALLTPTHAIAVDVSFALAPGLPRPKCGELDGGPMIGVSPILDNGMTKQLKQIATEEQIPFQLEVMGGMTCTDADQIAVSGAGVRCGLLSVPLRNMHSPVEIVATADIEAVAALMVAYAKQEFGGETNVV